MAINWGNATQGAMTGGSIGARSGNPWATAIGAGVGGLAGAFSGRNNSGSRKTDELLAQIPEHLRPYFEPYINAGKEQLPGLSEQYGSLLSNTGGKLNEIGAGYKESPGYKWNLDQGEQAIANAQARNGMAGTKQDQQYSGELASHLADQDFQAYLSHALGLYGTGLSGSQNLAQMGENAATEYGNNIGNTMTSRANLARANQYDENKSKSGLFDNLLNFFNKK